MLFKKGTKLYSILHNKCPRCQEGDFFIYSGFLRYKELLKLHDNCSNCELKYMMEPSFYYGSMFVNYGLTVVLSIAVFAISFLVFNLDLLQSFIAIVVALVTLSLYTLRLSRIIWINIFVKYNKTYSNQ